MELETGMCGKTVHETADPKVGEEHGESEIEVSKCYTIMLFILMSLSSEQIRNGLAEEYRFQQQAAGHQTT
jgi:hypothetical protein